MPLRQCYHSVHWQFGNGLTSHGHGYIKLRLPQHCQETLPKHCWLIKDRDIKATFKQYLVPTGFTLLDIIHDYIYIQRGCHLSQRFHFVTGYICITSALPMGFPPWHSRIQTDFHLIVWWSWDSIHLYFGKVEELQNTVKKKYLISSRIIRMKNATWHCCEPTCFFWNSIGFCIAYYGYMLSEPTFRRVYSPRYRVYNFFLVWFFCQVTDGKTESGAYEPTIGSNIPILFGFYLILRKLAPCQWGSHPDSHAC